VTPEDGLDVTAPIRTNVVSQSLVLTRTMNYWGRTGGVSIVVPYLNVESSSDSNRTAVRGVSDIGFLWQMNIFGGPALTREAFAFSLLFTGAGFAGARQSKRCIHSAARTPSGAGVRGK
jgi:hypothetical protein